MTWQALIDKTSYSIPLVIGYGPFTEAEVAEIEQDQTYGVVEVEDDQFHFIEESQWIWLLPDNTLTATPDSTPPEI